MAIEFVSEPINSPLAHSTSTCTACGALVSDSPAQRGPGEWTAQQLHERWHAAIDQLVARQPF
jgi:hypothetical protein